MIVDRLMRKDQCRRATLWALAGSVLAAVIVSVSVLVIPRLLGYSVHPDVAAALGAVAGASALANHRRN